MSRSRKAANRERYDRFQWAGASDKEGGLYIDPRLGYSLIKAGQYRMLRLQYERGAKEFSCLHDQKHTQSADTLHSMGEELPVYVRPTEMLGDRFADFAQ